MRTRPPDRGKTLDFSALNTGQTTDWAIAPALVPYPEALAAMEARAAAVSLGASPELVWLLEHPPLYTAGTSANPADLTAPDRFPVYKTGRGGQYTYHGPGQRIAYTMLDLRPRGADVRLFVQGLEEWIIRTLHAFNVKGERRTGRVGVWVQRGAREDKIAALGIRVRKGVAFHGISINVDPDLSHYTGIVPCGINEHGVTSLADLGLTTTMEDVDIALRESFASLFGSTRRADFAVPLDQAAS